METVETADNTVCAVGTFAFGDFRYTQLVIGNDQERDT